MLTPNDIRQMKFSTAMGGYKKDEVENFVDHVLEDYREYERTIKAAVERIDALTAEIEGLKASEESIQNVLINAQRLADSIVAEAKERSESIIKEAENSISSITEKERILSETFERKAESRREEVERELETKVINAEKKLAAIERATNDSINKQQINFNRLKVEVTAFKSEITKIYKQHLELLQTLPEETPVEPKAAAKQVAEEFDKELEAETVKAPETAVNEPSNEETPVTEADKNEVPSSDDFVNLVKEPETEAVKNPAENLTELFSESVKAEQEIDAKLYVAPETKRNDFSGNNGIGQGFKITDED